MTRECPLMNQHDRRMYNLGWNHALTAVVLACGKVLTQTASARTHAHPRTRKSKGAKGT